MTGRSNVGLDAQRRREVSRRDFGVRLAAGATAAALPALSLAEPASAKSPAGVVDWLRRPDEAPFQVPLDYFGIHSDHGLGQPVARPDYPYDAIRSHDADDARDYPMTQWSLIERTPGIYDWRATDAWIAASPGRTRIWVLFGCPEFYQKYPDEPWRYPYLPGGGSPPREPEAAARFIAALLARYPGQIQFVEIWNEPNFGWRRGQRRWGPEMDSPGFFTGTPSDLAALARAVKAVLPEGVKLRAGAWEGQDGVGWANSLTRFSLAADGAGGKGRDHVDALSVHSYTYDNDPEKMIAELRNYKARFAEAGYRPGLPLYVTECGAEAPGIWTRDNPPVRVKARIIKRWLMIPAALGYSGVYLYKHSYMRTLGDPAREPALGRAMAEARDNLRGREVQQAARLADNSIWLRFADGGEVRA